MYSDRAEEVTKRSVKERINGSIVVSTAQRRPVAGKRQRQDDKWEHDLFNDQRQVSRSINRTLDSRDLRLKLQKRSAQQTPQSGGVRDLREKLSGPVRTQPLNVNPPKPNPKVQAVKPVGRNTTGEASILQSRRVSSKTTTTTKKSQPKPQASSIDGFLRSLGLEKYQIQFQAEEVDMMALEHMTDDDLKVMGIPMGPRKKILSALASRT